jgi:site-specific recombinase
MDEDAEAEKKAQAEKERQAYILKEISVRAAFHRELGRWIELVNPNPADLAQLRELYALQDSRSPQPKIVEKSGQELDIAELWRIFNLP